MTGEWERKSDTVWTYRLAGAARPYGSVVQYKDTARSYGDWDATVTARAALERHAQQHADRIFG